MTLKFFIDSYSNACVHIFICVIFLFVTFYAVLIEKILRTVPDVGKIYVLIKANDKEVALKRLKNEVYVYCH